MAVRLKRFARLVMVFNYLIPGWASPVFAIGCSILSQLCPGIVGAIGRGIDHSLPLGSFVSAGCATTTVSGRGCYRFELKASDLGFDWSPSSLNAKMKYWSDRPPGRNFDHCLPRRSGSSLLSSTWEASWPGSSFLRCRVWMNRCVDRSIVIVKGLDSVMSPALIYR